MNEVDPSKTEGTPLTLERFMEWKAKFDKEMDKFKPKEKKSTKQTGREMFTYNPNLEATGLEDEGVSIYDSIDISNKIRRDEEKEKGRQSDEEDGEQNLEIDENLFEGEDLDELEDELEQLKV